MEERGDGAATNRENSRRVVLRLAALLGCCNLLRKSALTG